MHADFQRTRHDADQFAAEREGQLTTGKRAERAKRDIQCQQFVVLHW